MKVLFIGTTDILGGAAKVSFEIKDDLEANGDSVYFFVADKRSNDSSVKVIPRPKWRKYLSLALATEDVFSTDWILKTPEFIDADIVHCHNLHGRFFNLHTLEKMAEKKPVVWTLHDEWAITPHCAYTLEGTTMEHGLFTCPSLRTEPKLLWDNTKQLAAEKNSVYKHTPMTIVTPCHWLKERVEKTILGKKETRVIPNGVDTGIFTKTDQAEARQKLKLPLDKKIVLFLAVAGKANTWKGWKFTEEIIKKYENDDSVLFLNVGNFTTEAAQKNVEYRTHVSNPKELALYYSAADALLFTSIAENFPLVILEAMSCGLPVVSFDVGGVKEAVTHLEEGYIAPYQDVAGLEEGLDWTLTLSSEERSNLSQKAIQRAQEQFGKKKMTAAYRALYTELLSKKHD